MNSIALAPSLPSLQGVNSSLAETIIGLDIMPISYQAQGPAKSPAMTMESPTTKVR